VTSITAAPRPSASVRAVAGVPGEGWDDRLVALGGHFLQSRAWARCQVRMGWPVYHASGDGWMWLGIVQKVGPFRRLYLPYGPQVEDTGALCAALSVASACAREQRCHLVHCEPWSPQPLDPARCGARRVRPRQAEYTRVIRLDVDETTLRAGLSKGHRSAITAAERKGIVVEQSSTREALDAFLRMLRETSDRSGWSIYEDSYYRTIVDELGTTGEATLYVARHDGRAIGAAIVFDLGDTRYYAFASSAGDQEARRLGPGPPLVWRTMMDARAAGKQRFDFWGIAPPDEPGHPWSGFSAFKRSFGGEVLRRNGTWDVPVNAAMYRLWRLAQALRR
jgi:lipid II:glycine glycyltransferase (peptidoglycan interpeptide bridge formation enzyme)